MMPLPPSIENQLTPRESMIVFGVSLGTFVFTLLCFAAWIHSRLKKGGDK